MNISICSRIAAKILLQKEFKKYFFYDTNEAYLNYSGYAAEVIYIPLDVFQIDLPQADKIADFIRRADSRGQTLSVNAKRVKAVVPDCATAIMEYYSNVQSLFDDDRYIPDEMIFYNLLDTFTNVGGGYI